MKTQNLVLGTLVAGVLVWACGTDALIGGSCREGYDVRDGICALVAGTDPATGNVVPTPIPTDSPIKSRVDGGLPLPSDIPPAPTVVIPPYPPAPLQCAAPTVACRGECLDVGEDDPLNCGACGRTCPSNICVAGACQGATPGDIVLIGHDMSSARAGTVQAKVLGNAVGIPTTDPIRVLSYEEGQAAPVVAATRSVAAAGVGSRKVEFTTATVPALDDMNLYAEYDVVLFHGAGPSPHVNGARWSASLEKFTKAGGVVVAVDRGDSDVPGLVDSTGLLKVTGHTLLPASTKFTVASSSNVVGYKLLSPYVASGTSGSFTGVEPQSSDVTWVVLTADSAAAPVVIHKSAR